MTIFKDKQSNMTSYTGMFEIIIGVIILGIGTNFFAEYEKGGLSVLAIRDLMNITIISLSFLLYKLKILNTTKVFLVVVYCIVLSITLSIFFHNKIPNFVFETYFIRVQLVLVVMIFTVGIFVHPLHKLVIAGYNILFVISCAFLVPGYSPINYIFYIILVSSSAFFGYKAFSNLIRISKEAQESNKVITEQNSKLIEVNNFKNNLFKIIGHDLKTPIFQVSTLLDLMEESTSDREKREYIKHMKVSANNASELLESLLNWAKEQKSENQIIITEEFKIHQIVEKTLHLFEQQSSKKDIFLINATDEKQIMAFHSKSMETILRNLISNAIKFSPSGETIVVSSCVQDSFVKISVADNGVGIDSKVIEKIDENEIIVGNIGTNNEVGTGNGLSICKKLIEKYKGKLEIKNMSSGTIASVYIPV